jgi:hypothetical protein
VVVHNVAEVPAQSLSSAQAKVERILADAGVSVSWDSICPPLASCVQFIIRREPGGGPGELPPSALGTTLVGGLSQTPTCFIFQDRVQSFSRAHHFREESILAHAMAHELGHALLPAPAHTESGLMMAEWTQDNLRHALGEVRFTSPQAEAIRLRLSRYGPR